MAEPVTYDPRRAVEVSYTVMFEHHAEQEQIERAKGDVSAVQRHHEACRVLVKALTAEVTPEGRKP